MKTMNLDFNGTANMAVQEIAELSFAYVRSIHLLLRELRCSV